MTFDPPTPVNDDVAFRLQATAQQRRSNLVHLAGETSAGPVFPWRILGYVGAALMILAAFLPWVTMRAVLVGEVSVRGTDGDGLFAIGLGITVAVAFALRKRIFAIVITIASAAFTLFELAHVSHSAGALNADFDYGTVTMGFGLWVLAIGAATALVATFLNNWKT